MGKKLYRCDHIVAFKDQGYSIGMRVEIEDLYGEPIGFIPVYNRKKDCPRPERVFLKEIDLEILTIVEEEVND